MELFMGNPFNPSGVGFRGASVPHIACGVIYVQPLCGWGLW